MKTIFITLFFLSIIALNSAQVLFFFYFRLLVDILKFIPICSHH